MPVSLPRAGGGSLSDSQDPFGYKEPLRVGRELLKAGKLEDAEVQLRRSLAMRFTPWAAASLGKLLLQLNRVDAVHNLEDEAIAALGAKWERPSYFPDRRLPDREKAELQVPLISPLQFWAKESAAWARNKTLPSERLELAARDGYRITFHRNRREAQVLLVAFGAANSGLSERGFAADLARAKGYDYIYVAQRAKSWYQELSLDDFYQSVAPFAALYPRTVAYGSSLGAYCALYFGGAIGARVISSSPRNSLHPSVVTKKRATPLYRHADLDAVPISEHPPVVLHDPSVAVDVAFLNAVVKPMDERLKVIEVPFAGDAILQALRESGELSSFIGSLIERDEIHPIKWGGELSPIWQRERGRALIEGGGLAGCRMAPTGVLASRFRSCRSSPACALVFEVLTDRGVGEVSGGGGRPVRKSRLLA